MMRALRRWWYRLWHDHDAAWEASLRAETRAALESARHSRRRRRLVEARLQDWTADRLLGIDRGEDKRP